jgi:FecR-like protein
MRTAGWCTVLLAALGSLVLARALPAQAPAAEVLLVQPPAEVVAAGQTAARPATRGARLGAGDRVRTGRAGAVEIRLGDGSLVRLAELSDLEIDRLDVDPAGAPSASRFNLAAGQARAWVARQIVAKVATARGDFAIRTPTAVAAVRQTDFVVVHDASAVTRVYTFTGLIDTTAIGRGTVSCGRNRWTEVAPGRDPEPCRVIPLRDKRTLLKALAFRAATVNPGDLDDVAMDSLGAVLGGERLTGGRGLGGSPEQSGREDPAAREAPVRTTIGF